MALLTTRTSPTAPGLWRGSWTWSRALGEALDHLGGALRRAGGNALAAGRGQRGLGLATAPPRRLERLFGALAVAAERQLQGCKAQELANLAWAFAKATVQAKPLFTALAKVEFKEFTAQRLGNMHQKSCFSFF